MAVRLAEERVSKAIHSALKMLNIISEAEYPQIQVRAFHFINHNSWDKSYHLCVPLRMSKRICWQHRNHHIYMLTLKTLNKARNAALAGRADKAAELFYKAIKRFTDSAERIYIEERVGPYTFAIRILKSAAVVQ